MVGSHWLWSRHSDYSGLEHRQICWISYKAWSTYRSLRCVYYFGRCSNGYACDYLCGKSPDRDMEPFVGRIASRADMAKCHYILSE